mgnify:CR=1 FL=1
MFRPEPVTKSIYWLGVNDRTTDLFETLWPIPRGISYNAYALVDEKVALLDTVRSTNLEEYLGKLRAVLPEGRGVDYLVIHHMEQDHSGSIRRIRELFPEVQILGTQKTAGFLEELYGITENVKAVSDGDTLDLGAHTLRFFSTPMLHWPETMMSYEGSRQVLFPGDAFGTFAALDGGIFDDEIDIPNLEDEAIRYFANIIGKYSMMVQKALTKLEDLDVDILAPVHGPVWRSDPQHIIDLYGRLARMEGEPGVALVYGSMYGQTARMMEAVARGIAEEGVTEVRVSDASRIHVSYTIRDCWKYGVIGLGSPTYDTGLLPPVEELVRLLEHKGLKNRKVGVFGSYGWAGGAVKQLREFAEECDFDLVEPAVRANFAPGAEELGQCEELGRKLGRAVKDMG